ncbi:MAG TPA: tRNA uridine-5-carboxymethylaminomethyl(34) synthesis GTPase MnmE [Gammaproteobacteria bacterium]|nr:tRNA uridine-5-carboxymethylaminomethyl(34) synthesis GTPase MnmE [Gammaproteobacteria bacterium]
MNDTTDTIVALATPPGRGGVGVVRVSGPRAAEIARAVLRHLPAPRHASYGPFYDGQGAVLDHGIALYFPAPASYTGEDVLELQGHGGPVVLDMIQQRIVALGARPARPGEFTERAFLNDKMDLAQAEAVADLIDSASQQAVRCAQRSLQGEFSARIHNLVERITALRLYVEAAIDFPDEEIDFLADDSVRQRLTDIAAAVAELLAGARQGCLLQEGMRVVIMGRPNVGKSSLLNRLARREAAIVTDIAGTTRDVLREQITIDGMPLHISDTAGLRDSADPVEQLGIQRARDEMARADRILLLIDRNSDPGAASAGLIPDEYNTKLTLIHNKIDLTGEAPRLGESGGLPRILLSAATGAGIDLLCQHLKDCMGYHNPGEGAFMARRRHLDALQRAREHIVHGQQQLEHYQAGELLAEDLRQAQTALGEITGQVTADDLLGRIFGEFCIGK